MSPRLRLMFGGAAIALTLGAVPLALGRDLALQDRLQNAFQDTANATVGMASAINRSAINRSAKADRPASVARSDTPSKTISLQLNGVSATTVLVRIPIAQATRGGASAPSWLRSGDKLAVACEPAVSVLTDVAKRLQPGRCVT
jgi:hypothetical protein